jgi:hypothetical protein
LQSSRQQTKASRETWLKIKCTQFGTFTVTGFDPDGRTGVRSLNLVERQGPKIVSAGSLRPDGGDEPGSAETPERWRDGDDRGRTPVGGLRHAALKGIPEH